MSGWSRLWAHLRPVARVLPHRPPHPLTWEAAQRWHNDVEHRLLRVEAMLDVQSRGRGGIAQLPLPPEEAPDADV